MTIYLLTLLLLYYSLGTRDKLAEWASLPDAGFELAVFNNRGEISFGRNPW
jgi:hypothetical protein